MTVSVSDPLAPTGSAAQTFCKKSVPITIADLVVTGTTIQWYSTATGGSPLATTTALIDSTTYYASQTSCGL
ncbi:MAG: hypothetical protein H6584_04045 [Flavobacteriales bacterium]|nr:hypothetical protein [Flavobacteriales bacterium]